MRAVELLAPAKNLECGRTAIDHGADAVYIGAERYGARAAAGNSIDDIRLLCEYAHQYRAKVYVTVNTLLHPHEHDDVRQLLRALAMIGVDAILVQDMAVQQMVLRWRNEGIAMPALHASTQTDNRDADRVRHLSRMGFSRVVLARELSLEEMRCIHQQVPEVELEAFVHGALCVSYSGACYASEYCFGRSANRGECAQFCRLKFELTDAGGRSLGQRYWLSLRDMCRIDYLEEMLDAGVVSLKIEGRLKEADYVKNVVAVYSMRLNEVIRRRPNEYCRASIGRVEYTFTPNLHKTFNRGYTDYFLHGRTSDMASPDTPKAIGEYVGRVKEVRANSFTVAGTERFANGDGLCFFNDRHELTGVRVNRVENNRLFPYKMPQGLRAGAMVYRNVDQAFSAILGRDTAMRRIPVQMAFTTTDNGFALNILMEHGQTAMASVAFPHQEAMKPQRENIIRQLTKLGGTPFICNHISVSDTAACLFVPSSLLTTLRHQAVEKAREKGQPSAPSVGASLHTPSPSRSHSTKHRGVPATAPLMQCRYCIRYALGHCVRRGGTRPSWREPLTLVMGDGRRFTLQFDCHRCQMNILRT